jgi:hypothetical protein
LLPVLAGIDDWTATSGGATDIGLPYLELVGFAGGGMVIRC